MQNINKSLYAQHIWPLSGALFWQNKAICILLILLGIALTGALIINAGGPPTALAHFMYASIILASFRFGSFAGLGTGLLCGITAGPLAGLVAIGPTIFTGQQIIEWLIRITWYAGIGAILGSAFNYARSHAKHLDEHLNKDMATSLPNLRAAHRYIQGMQENQDSNHNILATAVKISNHQNLLARLGFEKTEDVMSAIALRLRSILPSKSFLSRTSHDIFMIIDSITPDELIDDYVVRVRGIDENTLRVGNLAVYIDTALGVAHSKVTGTDAQTLFFQAEIAAAQIDDSKLYQHYDPVEDDRRKDNTLLLADVGQAIQNGELHLVYQPKLNLHSCKVLGLEALARWQHPERGPISPGTFIPLIEQTRMIDEFTRAILREAIQQITLWRKDGYIPSVAVNISTRNLSSAGLLRYIYDLLQTHDVPASSLELEITESALMSVSSSRIDLLRSLQEKGVRIALDDFGTGYASLAYLRDLPIDILKLDRSFIKNIIRERHDMVMVKHIINMAKDLELEIVAEGIEDAETLQLLNDLGCDNAQGFYIAKPMPRENIATFLEQDWKAPPNSV